LCRESRAEWGKIESCCWKIVSSCPGKADGAHGEEGTQEEFEKFLVAAVGLEPTTYGLPSIFNNCFVSATSHFHSAAQNGTFGGGCYEECY
jgi:hypothetical protein